jgi:hypothetical protein
MPDIMHPGYDNSASAHNPLNPIGRPRCARAA